MNNETQIYSVSEINRIIKLMLEENIPAVWVQGEISNLKHHSSGHTYFTLKDQSAQISAVLWSSRAHYLNLKLSDGLLVQALGNIRVYEKAGRYQLDTIKLVPAGKGHLQAAFEELKLKLFNEGLFDEKFKTPLSLFPENVGIITSATGAAFKDILNILARRAPYLNIILRSVLVQGVDAANDIVKAIREFNQYKNIDAIILGRGGGSLEDLWPFNEEKVARAIFDSKIPIISAVGHEIDYTIADFVADLRAPTPSAAAELIVQDVNVWINELVQNYNKLKRAIEYKIEQGREKILYLQKSYGLRKPEDSVKQLSLQIDELSNRMTQGYMNYLEKYKAYLKQINLRLNNISPINILKRGYSITYLNGQILKDIRSIKANQEVFTQITNGRFSSKIINIETED